MNPQVLSPQGTARAHMQQLLSSEEQGLRGRLLRAALVVLILLSVTAAVLKSMPPIAASQGLLLNAVLLLTTLGFLFEYGVRVWIAAEDPGADSAWRKRLRYVFSVPGLIDLLAAIPFVLAPQLGLGIDWMDIVPIFKLLRHTAAFEFMLEAVISERRILTSAAVLLLVLLVFQSSLVYYLERQAQPDKFGSIPDAMWWGIVTLTTVGYGDVTPVTAWGKLVAGLTAVMGLCLFAIPVGVFSSAFMEAVRRRDFVDTWNLVAKVPLFRTLGAARIAAVAAVLRPRRAARGERLITKGERADAMYFIVSGEVEVDTETGTVKRRMGAGDFFGEVALIAESNRTATLHAVSDCRLLVLLKHDFESFMATHKDVQEALRIEAKRRQEGQSA